MTKVDLPILLLPCCENVHHEIVSEFSYLIGGMQLLAGTYATRG